MQLDNNTETIVEEIKLEPSSNLKKSIKILNN